MLQYDTALNCYEKAALERPMYAEAYCNMGVIFKNRGELESAIACYERFPDSCDQLILMIYESFLVLDM